VPKTETHRRLPLKTVASRKGDPVVLPSQRTKKSPVGKLLDAMSGNSKRPSTKKLQEDLKAKLEEVNKHVDSAERALLSGEIQPEDFSD